MLGNDCRWQQDIQLRRGQLNTVNESSKTSLDGHLLIDHQQPRGIPVLTLKGLRVCLTFESRERPCKRRKLMGSRCDQGFESLLDADDAPVAGNLSGATKHQNLTCGLPCILPGDSETYSSDELMLLVEDDATTHQSISPSSHTNYIPDPSAWAVRDAAIISLVDAGIRRAIVSKPYKVARTIQHSVESGSTRLIDIAPCICYPGHLQVRQECLQHIIGARYS